MGKVWIKTLTAIGISGAMVAPGLACVGLRDGPRGIVLEVSNGDTVVLDSGLKVRLIAIQAPKLPLGQNGYQPWPLAERAKQALTDLSLGQRVQIRYGGAERDRHGRVLGQMYVGEDEIWAQQEMLLKGLARVYSFTDNRLCLDELLRAEATARAEKTGIWNNVDFYAVRPADQPLRLLERTGTYVLVEGRVLNADRYAERAYLNFGRVWKEDFTIVIERSGLRLFDRAGIDPLDLEGALIRVRGWIDDANGPRIEVTHPEQIELLAR